jgi:hypothetical protein
MSSESNRQLLTIGVIILTVVVAIVLYVAGLIDWTLIVPVFLLLSGVWIMVLGFTRLGNPRKYERSGFSTMAFGAALIAIGGAWALFSTNWLYSLIIILLVVAGLTIATALRRK